MTKTPFTPSEFDAACRELELQHPACWATSGYRGAVHNIAVGGHPSSKHTMSPCMARDYSAPTHAERQAIAATAQQLGLWWKVKPHGTGPHVHIQGLPSGPVVRWWLEKYSTESEV